MSEIWVVFAILALALMGLLSMGDRLNRRVLRFGLKFGTPTTFIVGLGLLVTGEPLEIVLPVCAMLELGFLFILPLESKKTKERLKG